MLPELPDCEMELRRQWLPEDEAEEAFVRLQNDLKWEERELMMFGRKVKQPRLTCLYGDDDVKYSYTGSDWQANPWHPLLLPIVDRIEREYGVRPNSVLCNLYRHGNDSVGWHADLGGNDGAEPTIFSLSLGVSRTFMIKHNTREEMQYKFLLASGDLLKMGAPMQSFWKHQVPKELVTGVRVNLTFRVLIDKPRALKF